MIQSSKGKRNREHSLPGNPTAFLRHEEERLQQAITERQVLTDNDQRTEGDLADLALGTAQDAQASALLVHLHGLLEQVQAARARVVAGTYGTCTQCAQPIPLPRLQALPYAALCVNCQSGSERNRKSRRIRRV